MHTFISVLSVALFLCPCYKVLPNLLWWHLFTDSFIERHKCAVWCSPHAAHVLAKSKSALSVILAPGCLGTYCPQVELLIPLCTSCGEHHPEFEFQDIGCILMHLPLLSSIFPLFFVLHQGSCWSRHIQQCWLPRLKLLAWLDPGQSEGEKSVKTELSIPALPCTESSFP